MISYSFLATLNAYIAEYLAELPDDDGEEIYASYRQLAEEQLVKFAAFVGSSLVKEEMRGSLRAKGEERKE